jgi:transcriptional regulator with XRE-family HTH domain
VSLAEQFGHNLLTERRRLGMSQEALADAAGLGRESVYKIERGGRWVRLLTLLRLADALGVDPCELLKGLP